MENVLRKSKISADVEEVSEMTKISKMNKISKTSKMNKITKTSEISKMSKITKTSKMNKISKMKLKISADIEEVSAVKSLLGLVRVLQHFKLT